ncbi:peroxide stress protein YaaA [Mycolicibacterium komossense]|uniref:Peroxide stress protein YaaA n=1 Tax=Mycolicibacterium komossense TaxID=1779 RepID=A0ABT3C8Y3_9MYCO|nr:peroxide stress protein YaaA [Mycolicibacterium komossense]MCV7225944.1 peroxide stress protein YaaA [Mycolicibacterium komossense]
MLVLLPPSETKRDGGDGPPLQLDSLSFPSLTPLREALIDEVVALAADVPASRRALKIAATLDGEIERNAALRTAPTLPAIHRYTGVLYDALDFGSLKGAAAERARSRLAVGSALFGLVRADDAVPAYRLSAGSSLPSGGTLAARWQPLLEPELRRLAAEELIVDLRSGSYVSLGRLPDAVRVDVVNEAADGKRTVVSHFNKSHKGRLARVLAGTKAELTDAAGVTTIARRAGFQVERRGNDLTIVLSS